MQAGEREYSFTLVNIRCAAGTKQEGHESVRQLNVPSRARHSLAKSLSRRSIWIQKLPSDDFQRQDVVDLAGVIADTGDMIAHKSLDHTSL